MKYEVTIKIPTGFDRRSYGWESFESGYLGAEVERIMNKHYPDQRYVRDNAGVIIGIGEDILVWIEGK